MTERGLPIVDGAPACPFVAFEDDRDERAASPDHRHRCYAEAQPAPRALAHQEAYCLSSAFPVCPTFQDWARREAARSRGQEPRQPADSVAAAAMPPQRNPPRNWAEPPPWSSRGGRNEPAGEDDWEEDAALRGLAGAGGAAAAAGSAAAADGGPGMPEAGRGLSGSYADRVASDGSVQGTERDRDEHEGDDDGDDDDAPIGAVPPYAPPISRETEPASQDLGQRSTAPPVYESGDAWADDDGDADMEPDPPARRHRERDPERMAALRGEAPRGGAQGAGTRPVRHRDDAAPEWERARPLEAYPTLRSRRLSELSIPPLLVAIVALALAAAVLFALPGLLGFGKPSAGQSNAPSVPVTTPLVTPAPTPVPKPTDQLYVVQSGDTLSGIAKKFKVTLADLIAANAETLPDPNKLSIGDQLIIPAKNPTDVPAAS